MTAKTKARTAPSCARLDALLAGRFQVLPFADLPRPYQLSMAHYMAVDGEAWEDLMELPKRPASRPAIKKALIEALPLYVRKYAAVRFGVAKLPTSDVLASIVQDPEIAGDWPNWKAYHEWYVSVDAGDTPNHPETNRWPVILSSTDDETLQDGWHRLHCYVRQNARVIPAIFYPQPHHVRAARRRAAAARA